METGCVHDFHFIMDREMKERLKGLDLFESPKSLSGVMVNILNVLVPVIRREHKWGRQRLSRYRSVCDDPEVIREDVHMYVKDELYRELKLLHQDLNYYSIAQLVREFFDFFLGLVDVYKNDVFQELKKLFFKWRSEKKQTRLTSRKFLRHLWQIIHNLPGNNRLITVYNKEYSPFWIFRI